MRSKALRVAGHRSTQQREEVARWWEGLTPAERRSLEVVGRPRVEVRFVEPGSDDAEVAACDFYEYLVNHELSYVERTFHICSAHADARAVVAAGRIPAGFRCPRAESDCPMRRLLDQAPGRDARLILVEEGQ